MDHHRGGGTRGDADHVALKIRAGQPLHPGSLAALAHNLGVPTTAGRTAAIRQHVLDMPAPIVAIALGYHHVTTAWLATEAGTTWSNYAPGDHRK